MRRYLSTVTLLALAACGGSGGDPGGGAGGAGGGGGTHLPSNVWHEDGQICVRYRPHPGTSPEERVDCVPEDWPSTSFCWRTQDELDCKGIPIGCVAIAENWAGADIGEITLGCMGNRDCLDNAIDNPECCGESPGSATWDCATN